VSEIPERLVADWWQTVAEHRTQGGVCVLCGVRKCRPRAEAFAQLIVHDFLPGAEGRLAAPRSAAPDGNRKRAEQQEPRRP